MVACLLACLFACLLACLLICACLCLCLLLLLARLLACSLGSSFAHLLACLLACLLLLLLACQLACLLAYFPAPKSTQSHGTVEVTFEKANRRGCLIHCTLRPSTLFCLALCMYMHRFTLVYISPGSSATGDFGCLTRQP